MAKKAMEESTDGAQFLLCELLFAFERALASSSLVCKSTSRCLMSTFETN